MRPRGRPPATRNVFAFDGAPSPLPRELLLDTSYVVEALITTQPQHQVCVDFLVALAEDDVALRFNEMLELELAETAFQLALKERHKRDWKRSRHDGRVRPRASRLMAEVADAWDEVLSYFDHTRVTIQDVVADVPRLMSEYGLASYDAVHAATALAHPAVGIVTRDVGFASLPAADAMLVTDSTRVARCREIRRRR